jgi:hypothetical protein
MTGISGLKLIALLIHKIGHATANAYHGIKWQTEMMETANEAERLLTTPTP